MWFLFLMRLYVVSFHYEVVRGLFSFMRLYVVYFPL